MGLLDAFKDKQFRDDVADNGMNFLRSASNAAAGNVTGPVDMLAWALRKAGVPVGDAPLGGSQWAKNAGLLNDVQHNSPSSLAGETMGLLAPIAMTAGAPKIAGGLLQMADNVAAPQQLNKQLGMIYTGEGRIPETLSERAKMRDMLEKYAAKSGYEITPGSAFSGASLYSDITNPNTGARAIVRISDHAPAMKYVDKNTPYFSVDPTKGEKTSGGTFEQAVKWLGDNGLPINTLGPKYEAKLLAHDADIASVKAQHESIKLEKELAQKEIAENLISQGHRYQFPEQGTKINSGGRRYDIYDAHTNKTIPFYSKTMPEAVRNGGKDAIHAYIKQQLGAN